MSRQVCPLRRALVTSSGKKRPAWSMRALTTSPGKARLRFDPDSPVANGR